MKRSRAAWFAAVVAGVLVATPALAHPGHPGKEHGKGKGPKKPPVAYPCVGDPARVTRFELPVNGEVAWGLYALPAKPPKGVVVFAHGYGHTAESWRNHLASVARRDNVVAVAMNYRGQVDSPSPTGGLPSSRGWQVAEGADDSIAAAKFFDATCKKLDRNVIFGVSMGGNTSGLVAAAKPKRANGKPLFDYLVHVEGAANVTETYHEARSLAATTGNAYAQNATADIERQMGGKFEDRRDVYLQRTVVNRVGDIAASGIKGVVIVHGVGDGLVPYNQSREFSTLLRAHGMKVDFFTALTRGDSSEPGTTLDEYVTKYVPGGVTSPFAGHASETSESHLVMRTAFDRLSQLYAATPTMPACREMLVDGTVGPSAPHPITTGPTC